MLTKLIPARLSVHHGAFSASLLRKSITVSDDYADYYWVGDLPPLVIQTSEPLFTPSPGQLFTFYIDRIYDLILGNASPEQRVSRGYVLNDLYTYFMKDGFAITWASLINEDPNTLTGHLLTMSVCMWELHGLEVMEHQSRLLVLTAAVIDALQNLSDRDGLSHSMSPTSPPRISEKHFITHVTELGNAIEKETEWRVHLDTRVRLISDHFISGEYSHWPMMHISWWYMSQSELIGTHTTLTSLRLELAERRATERHIASTSTKANDDTLTVPGGTRQVESSGANTIDFPRNANSVNNNVIPRTSDAIHKTSEPSVPALQEVPLIEGKPASPPRPSPPEAEAFGRNHSGDSYRGDPMEPLDYPEAIPPRGENHYLGRFVAPL